MPRRARFPRWLFAGVLLIAAAGARAASLSVEVTDAAGRPLADAAVYAALEGSRTQVGRKPRRPVAIEQADLEFSPRVTVVQTGTAVSFPNRDSVRHHVYSFSPAKTFEIKLYAGTPAQPVVFDKAGEVVLGCNIHDEMRAFVYVVDTPYFARTDASGRARLEDLPAGAYAVGVWHPEQAGRQAPRKRSLRAEESAAEAFALPLRSRAPAPK